MITPVFFRRRRPRPSVTFLLTFATICCLALLSISLAARSQSHQYSHSRLKRDFSTADKPECREIHHATNQCAFYNANCQEDDTGMISYLSFYYCTLPRLKPLAFCIIALWASFLFTTIGIAASDFLSVNLQSIANIFRMGENLTGVTFLAFGNGSPDVFSTWAAMSHHSGSLAVGELIGAASFITAVIPAAMMFVKPFKVGSRSFVRDVIFFAVAVGFSMYFLANGRLELWESLVMIVFYIVYIVFVVVHHWHMTRRRARREQEAAARAHYITPDIEVPDEAYHDDDDDHEVDETQPLVRTVSDTDFDDLERADDNDKDAEDEDRDPDEEEEDRDKVLGEINSNMRIARPQGRRRTNTGPIRPSLIGALEFQAVLSSLRSQQNIPVIPLNHRRRHSAAMPTRRRQPRRQDSAISEGPLPLPRSDSTQSYSSLNGPSTGLDQLGGDLHRHGSRQRAVSANDAAGLRFDPGQIERRVWARKEMVAEERAPSSTRSEGTRRSPRPFLSITPPPEAAQSLQPQQLVSADTDSNSLLAPPGSHPQTGVATPASLDSPIKLSSSPVTLSPDFPGRPQLKVSPPTNPRLPGAMRSSSKQSPLMRYRDNPEIAEIEELMLPSPHEEINRSDNQLQNTSPKCRRWWPQFLFPSPRELFRALFPSLKLWTKTNIWGKLVGLASVPSVFILTITLPVVEFDRAQVDEKSSTAAANIRASIDGTAGAAVAVEQQLYQRVNEEEADPDEEIDPPIHISDIEATLTTAELAAEWNRWLLVLQLIISPAAFVLLQWAGDDDADRGFYLKVLLFTLLGSLVVVIVLVLTTSPVKPPPWHRFLSFFGFFVSVFWISTIAEEVVGVLKAIGVIFNISEAILGLTIFAVGNSLGDLVADITVARLGFPVMALSACFGGPMMNILIGIGTAGAWHTWKGTQKYRHKHPDRPHKWKPYHLEVDVTLMISAVGLLVTLLAYLVVVPLNKWRLDRKIGVGLAALWLIATIINVVVEVTGIGGRLNYHED